MGRAHLLLRGVFATFYFIVAVYDYLVEETAGAKLIPPARRIKTYATEQAHNCIHGACKTRDIDKIFDTPAGGRRGRSLYNLIGG